MEVPKNELLWAQYMNGGRTEYVLTSNKERSVYYLYNVAADGKLKKIGRGKTPPELEQKYLAGVFA